MTLPRLRLQKEVLSKRESRSKSYALLPPTPPHPQRFSLMSRGLVCPTYAKPAPPSPGEGASGTPPCPFLQGSSQTRRCRPSCGVVHAPLTDIMYPCDDRRSPTSPAAAPRDLPNPRPPPFAGPGATTDHLRLPASARRGLWLDVRPHPHSSSSRPNPVEKEGSNSPLVCFGVRC